MSSFLERTAKSIIETHGVDLQRVAIVIPGQRAAAHLQRYLAKAVGKAFWAPEMLDMGRFLAVVADARQASQVELLLTLHRLHGTLVPSGSNDLAEFLQWGPTVLHDMSEVDHHLIGLDDLYRDLRSFAEIDQWSLALDADLSEGQQQTVALWERNGRLHRSLHEQMAIDRRGSSGWVAHEAALRAASAQLPWDAVWCVGANALEPAATAVLRTLRRRGMLHLAWDTDPYYLDDRTQEAGRFIRRTIEALGPGSVPPADLFRGQERTVRSIVVPDARAQALHAAQWLSDLPEEERSNTIVLLADESLLPPFTASLSASCGNVNISTGLPWTNWPVKGLLDQFIDLQTILRKDGTMPVDKLRACLLHPLIAQGPADHQRAASLSELQRSHLCLAEVQAALRTDPVSSPLLAGLGEEELRTAVGVFLSMLASIHGNSTYALEQIQRTAEAWEQLHATITDAGLSADHELAQRDTRDRLMEVTPLGFYGDPWNGLQVMGLLETRALSPERVLVIGANEGHLPRKTVQQSFIPHDLRKALGLPLRHDSEAVQAYHFQRLVQYTRELVLISHAGGGIEPAEPTRYLAQWAHELVPVSRTLIEHRAVAPPPSGVHHGVVQVERAPWIVQELEAIAARGLSPSALAMWLRCPLDLFFRRVLRVQELEERSSRLEGHVLGNAVHEVLRKAVQPHVGRVLSAEDVASWREGLGPRLAAEVATELKGADLDRGHHLLSLAMAEQALDRHLHSEAVRLTAGASVTPLAVELDLDRTLPNGIRIIGRCDRVDLRDGVVHILDLKTGTVRPEHLKLRSLERGLLGPEHGYSLQLLTYAWAYLSLHPEVEAVRTGLVPLQQPSKGEGLWLSIDGDQLITRGIMDRVEKLLSDLTDEIVRGHAPFQHDPASQYCVCCLG